MSVALVIGQTYTLEHPFVRSTYFAWDEDGGGNELSWKPGVIYEGMEDDYRSYTICYAHGVGSVHYTVVSVHHPRPYPARVFYTRKWTDPDGRTFGKNKLLMTTLPALRRRVNESGMVRHKVEEVVDMSEPDKRKLLEAA
jgi:hypothetical protein